MPEPQSSKTSTDEASSATNPSHLPTQTADGATVIQQGQSQIVPEFLAPPKRPGELGRLGPYRILGELGRGGMGMVFRAEDPALKRQVALKVMLPQHAGKLADRARFLREARAQAAVEHDHVVAIYQVGEDRGMPFLAMPLLTGQTLAAALMQNPRPPLGEVLRIGREIAEGLAAAHERGLIHRDIKPANVWLEGRRRRVKILDFGLARIAQEKAGDNASFITQEGMVVGTPSFMSPEQARGRAVDFRTDLFSLGVVLYQLAAGELPFQGPNVMAVLTALAVETPSPLLEKNPSLPPELVSLIGRLLEKSPANRPAGAQDVADQLRRIEEAATTVVAIPYSAEAAADPWASLVETEVAAEPVAASVVRSRRPTLYLLVGAVAVVGTALAAFYFSGKKKVETAASKSVPPSSALNPPPSADVPKIPASAGPAAPAKDPDRRAAETLRVGYSLTLLLPNGTTVEVKPSSPQLPDGPFVVDAVTAFPSADKVSKEAFLAALAELTALRSIHCNKEGPAFTDDDLDRLAKMPLAQTIANLRLRAALTPRLLDNLRSFPKVYWLSVSAKTATDDLLVRLGEFQQIRSLSLDQLGVGGVVTDRGIAALAGLRLIDLGIGGSTTVTAGNLRLLVAKANLARLHFPGSNLSDEGIAELVKLTKLKRLDLAACKAVTEKSVPLLSGLKHLDYLSIHGTDISEGGAKQIQDALPNCTVDTRTPYAPAKELVFLTDERKQAAALLPIAQVWYIAADGIEREIPTAGPLPNEPFAISQLIFFRGPDLTGKRILDEIASLTSLKSLSAVDGALNAAEMDRLPKMPFAATLEHLQLGIHLTPDNLDRIKAFPKLRGLKMNGATVGDDVLVRLKELPDLQVLRFYRLGDSGKCSDRGYAVMTKLPLQELSLQRGQLSPELLARIAAMPELMKLYLDGSNLKDSDLEILARTPKLQNLNVTKCQAITDAGVESFAKFTGLKELAMGGTKLSPDGLKRLKLALPQCSVIKEPNAPEKEPVPPADERKQAAALLPLAQVWCLTADKIEKELFASAPLPNEPFRITQLKFYNTEPKITGQRILDEIASLTALKSLTSTDGDMNAAAVDRLSRMPFVATLEHLQINAKLTSANLDRFKTFPKLRGLKVEGTAVGDDLLVRLQELPELQLLGLYGLGASGACSDRGYAGLAKLPLRDLHLHKGQLSPELLARIAAIPELRKLWLTDSSLKDSDLAILARAPKLEELRVTLCKAVTDAGVDSLQAMTNLKVLQIRGTGISDAGAARLKKALPKCRFDTLTPSAPEKEPVPPADERKQAAALLPLAKVRCIAADGIEREIPAAGSLPNEPFTISRLTFYNTEPKITGPRILEEIASMTALKSLTSSDGGMNTAAVDQLSRMPFAATLEQLQINTQLTPANLDRFKTFPKLRGLKVTATAVGDDMLVRLQELPDLQAPGLYGLGASGTCSDRGYAVMAQLLLQELNLHKGQLSPELLARIAAMPELKKLDLSHSNLKDSDLETLARSPKLEVLFVLDCKAITDAGVESLQAMTNLKLLNIRGSGISTAGAARLKKALPKCVFDTLTPNAPAKDADK